MVEQQRLDLTAQFQVAGACLVQECRRLLQGQIAGCQEDLLDLLVALWSHAVSPSSSRRSQARTMVHSRSADRFDIPRTTVEISPD